MSMQYCMKCMNRQFPGVAVCPNCGTPYNQPAQKPNALKPGQILNGKYLVGAVLGEGGFGITYIGLDLLLEKKVAVKEYYPISTGMVSRKDASAVVWNSEVRVKNGQVAHLDSFLQEARKLAKVDSIPCVVKVRDLFSQNNTAYIVMDFVEGETLLKKLQREGPMPFAKCVSMLTPIIQALEQVHRLGIVHRDISPDNIMVRPDGSLMLLDLGAAKEIDIQKTDGSIQSSQIVAKDGFSPLEQYSSSGRIGTWTDVYSMSATIYYCCTGKLPPRATSRTGTDSLVCVPPLQEREFAVLKQGMALDSRERIKTMRGLLAQLQAFGRPPRINRGTVNAPGSGKEMAKRSPNVGMADRGAKDAHSVSKVSPRQMPRLVPALVEHSMPAAGILFGVEAMVFLCVYILGSMPYALLFRIAGCLLSVYALLRAKPGRNLFCAACVALCLAYGSAGSLAGKIGGIAVLSISVLLLAELANIPGSRERLRKYWFIPMIAYCVYLIVYCAESFDFPFFIMESVGGCALTLAMRGFALQNDAGK